ncbi:hypothetical protein FPV67DRAFT_1444608 [Lyophyllum atratum]|nr:hypothetical protein FPV67DRAFT_1444608 [Lyophyllum atratum]
MKWLYSLLAFAAVQIVLSAPTEHQLVKRASVNDVATVGYATYSEWRASYLSLVAYLTIIFTVVCNTYQYLLPYKIRRRVDTILSSTITSTVSRFKIFELVMAKRASHPNVRDAADNLQRVTANLKSGGFHEFSRTMGLQSPPKVTQGEGTEPTASETSKTLTLALAV